MRLGPKAAFFCIVLCEDESRHEGKTRELAAIVAIDVVDYSRIAKRPVPLCRVTAADEVIE